MSCENNVTYSNQAIQCDLCDSWVHIKCNGLNYIHYKFLQSSNDGVVYILCCSEIFPFNTVKNKNFIFDFYDNNSKSKNIDKKNSSLLLKPSEHLKHLVNQFNNMSSSPGDNNSDDPANTVSSKYYDTEELQNLKINKIKSLSLFHINACSFSKNFDDLQHLLSCTNKNFDIIAITETRITKNVSLANNLNIKNYSTEFTQTESSAGDTLFYIANHLSYKSCQDLTYTKRMNWSLPLLK